MEALLFAEQPVRERLYAGKKARQVWHAYETAYADLTVSIQNRRERAEAAEEDETTEQKKTEPSGSIRDARDTANGATQKDNATVASNSVEIIRTTTIATNNAIKETMKLTEITKEAEKAEPRKTEGIGNTAEKAEHGKETEPSGSIRDAKKTGNENVTTASGAGKAETSGKVALTKETWCDRIERRYAYDFRGNLIAETDGEGGQSSFCYDRTGALIRAVSPEEYAKSGSAGAGTTFHYDADGNLTARINAEGETELRLTYDRLHRVVSETDGEGTVIHYRYTPTGKRKAVTDRAGTLLSRTVYDLWDRPECTIDGAGIVTRYQKDRWGRITEVTKADGSTERYAYDFAGNVTAAWDALGRKTSFSYTSQGKMSGIKHTDGSTEYRIYDR